MRRSTFLLLAAASCTSVWAQVPAVEPIGLVSEVRGLVTMSFGSNVATVQPDTPVFDGARFVASSSGDAELKFDNGCVVKLRANQWLAVDGSRNCQQQIAAVRSLTESGVFADSSFARTALPLLAAAAAAGAVARLPDPKITPTPP